MPTPLSRFQTLSDQDLLREVTRLAGRERHATAQLIASLAALDARRLYLTEGFSSLFEYCSDSLRLSEHAAYDRITAARAARRFPVILDRLADGSVTLTAVRLLVPHLTNANCATLLAEAAHRSKREVEHIVARLHPQPDVPASVRKLPVPARSQQPAAPARTTGEPVEQCAASATSKPASRQSEPSQVSSSVSATPSPRPAVVAPIAPARYKISFTVGAETYAKLRQVQDLLRHAVPDGDPAMIYDRALTALLTQLMKPKEPKRNSFDRATGSEPGANARQRKTAKRWPDTTVAPSSRGRPARRVAARWGPMHVCEPDRATLHCAGVARVSPHGAVRRRRRGVGR